MIKKMNDIIAKLSVIIFLTAATEKFVFWIINMVDQFKWNAGSGVKTLFQGFFEMVIALVILGVVLAISVKISGVKPISFMKEPDFPALPTAPQQKSAAPKNAVVQNDTNWYCTKCGASNDVFTGFCKNCGKPRQ